MAVGRRLLKHRPTDPMSGFFALRREVLDSTARKLSMMGFKILLDILLTSECPLKVAELPYRFRERRVGESKVDELVVWEYGMLLADKMIGR